MEAEEVVEVWVVCLQEGCHNSEKLAKALQEEGLHRVVVNHLQHPLQVRGEGEGEGEGGRDYVKLDILYFVCRLQASLSYPQQCHSVLEPCSSQS